MYVCLCACLCVSPFPSSFFLSDVTAEDFPSRIKLEVESPKRAKGMGREIRRGEERGIKGHEGKKIKMRRVSQLMYIMSSELARCVTQLVQNIGF